MTTFVFLSAKRFIVAVVDAKFACAVRYSSKQAAHFPSLS